MPHSFPLKLHELLNTVHEEGLEWIVSWSPQGNGFKVHNVKEFVSEILPRFFMRQTKYKSFQRQLNIWDFDRIAKGPLAGAYVHSKFLRGKPTLCFEMVRQRQVPGFLPPWQCDDLNDQGELERNQRSATINAPTIDDGSHVGEQKNEQVKGARPMTLNDCIAFFCEKERVNKEAHMVLSCSKLPPIFSFDNLFEDCYTIDGPPLEPTHSQTTSSNHWVEPWHTDDMGAPFNPMILIEPVLHDMEMIFS